jgi:hypothetical protein
VNNGTTRMQEAAWKHLYEVALLEKETELLSQRIAEAQKAIRERTLSLLGKSGDNIVEREMLAYATIVLEDLQRMYSDSKSGKNA